MFYAECPASAQVGAKTLDAFARLLQHRSGGRIGNAECRTKVKCRAPHPCQSLSVERVLDKVFIGRDLAARWRGAPDRFGAGRIDIERPFGLGARDAFRL